MYMLSALHWLGLFVYAKCAASGQGMDDCLLGRRFVVVLEAHRILRFLNISELEFLPREAAE